MYYKGNWLHAQPSVNISLLPMAKRIYSLRAISEHITVTCRPCKIKGCTHEFENQSPRTTAIAPFKPSKTSTSHVRNWVHLLPCCSCWSAVPWGIQHTRMPAYAGRQTAIFASAPHKEPCGMQSSLVPTQTACPCSVITLELVAINPNSWTRIILLEEASLGLLQVRKTAFKYLQRLHSHRFFCWSALYTVWATVKCHTWGYQLKRQRNPAHRLGLQIHTCRGL